MPGEPTHDRDTRPTIARLVVETIVDSTAHCRCICGLVRMLTADEVYVEAVPRLDDETAALADALAAEGAAS